MKGWHFVGDKLRDGRPVPLDGEWLVHKGPIVTCGSGLHFSRRLIDALRYAPGATICRVEVGGAMVHEHDKGVASERKIIWRVDGEDVLRNFARQCALDVIGLWDAPDVVVQYLQTGDRSIANAARDAAGAAAGAAASAAAWSAAWAGARAGARAAAWDAAWAAARAAAWAGAAAGVTAWDAAWNAAGNAAWAGAAAWDAAWNAALDKQNRRITSMVMALHRKGDS